MLEKLKIVCLLLCSFVLTGCPEKEDDNSAEILTTGGDFTAASDFELFYSNSGGMSPESEHIYISSDSASWKYGRYKKETLISWIPKSEDLNNLFKVLKENNYLKIESREEQEVYDRGGVRMTIINDGEKTKLDNSGRTFVKEKWSHNFRAIRDYIKTYVKAEVDKQLIRIPFVADASLKMNSEPVKVWLNDNLFYSNVEDKVETNDTITAYPGLNVFNWSIYFADSVNYKNDPIYQFGGEGTFSVSRDAGSIIMLRENQEILMNVP